MQGATKGGLLRVKGMEVFPDPEVRARIKEQRYRGGPLFGQDRIFTKRKPGWSLRGSMATVGSIRVREKLNRLVGLRLVVFAGECLTLIVEDLI